MSLHEILLGYALLVVIGLAMLAAICLAIRVSQSRVKPMRQERRKRKRQEEEVPEAELVDDDDSSWGECWKYGIRPDGSHVNEED